ncbi:MAG: hypothetical protein COT17_01460 [Elusimicrobia bacterium CG08_land_8_20_14_0_20_51_18]|nr:MAG: hypothetical protein COT17_01460 [Elusimicrobia bacterium CG08_land_8_20_14_0_20_51_18]
MKHNPRSSLNSIQSRFQFVNSSDFFIFLPILLKNDKLYSMVMVINLNIAIDKTANVGVLEKGNIYRYPEALTFPGGKGINVARALKTLGIEPEIRGFVSGFNGRWIEKTLVKAGFKTSLVRHKNGESRICYSIVENGGVSTDFNEDGPSVPAAGQKEFLKRFEKDVKKFKIISISGRTSPGLGKGFYSKMVRLAKKNGVMVFVDTTCLALREAVLAGADAVKINHYEFEEFFGKKFSEKNVAEFYSRHEKFGLKTIVVTNRNKPFYCCCLGKVFKIVPPEIKELKSPVGAGDSFMAGFIFSVCRGKGILETLKLSCAASCSDCGTLGAGLISRKAVNFYKNKIKVVEIGGK